MNHHKYSGILLITLIINAIFSSTLIAETDKTVSFPWLEDSTSYISIEEKVAPPSGYERMEVGENSFAFWLRQLPLYPKRKLVRLYNGFPKINQFAHYAVLNVDVDDCDLQQCADAIMRLRAEYLLWSNQPDKIHFNFTSGDRCSWNDWKNGIQPVVDGNNVSFRKIAEADSSYKNFRQYLLKVFTYAGSASLSNEMKEVKSSSEAKIGDVFVQGGYPGHAVIIVDMAINKSTGEKVMMLAQSYTPAQQIHILKNHQDSKMSPWFKVEIDKPLDTPEWDFPANSLKKF